MSTCARCGQEMPGEGVENHHGEQVCSPRVIYGTVGVEGYVQALVDHGLLLARTKDDPEAFGRGVFVCGRGRRLMPTCYACRAPGNYQCDFFVDPPGTQPRRRRCDRHVCAEHRTPLGPKKDACPEHAEACLAALARQRAGAQV